MPTALSGITGKCNGQFGKVFLAVHWTNFAILPDNGQLIPFIKKIWNETIAAKCKGNDPDVSFKRESEIQNTQQEDGPTVIILDQSSADNDVLPCACPKCSKWLNQFHFGAHRSLLSWILTSSSVIWLKEKEREMLLQVSHFDTNNSVVLGFIVGVFSF